MRTATHFPVFDEAGASDIGAALRLRALERRDAPACVLLDDGGGDAEVLTYGALAQAAMRAAGTLRSNAPAGSRVLLAFPAGVEFLVALFGCVFAGMIAVPGPPPRGMANAARLRGMAQDCGAALALTTPAFAARLNGITGLAAIEFETLIAAAPADPAPAHAVALLQYTSGSTGDPKGVIVSHRALWANQAVIRTYFGHEEGVTLVGWLPNFHDMGLVGNLLQPLYAGGVTVMMAPAAFMQRPLRWLQAIARYRAHTSGAPNFAYDLCVRAAVGADLAGLDLSAWRVAFNGAEPVRGRTLETFAATFGPCGFDRRAFMPCYGLAESTLMVAGAQKGGGAVVGVRGVACGEPVAGVPVLVGDAATGAPLPDGEVGEILVGGDSLCDGYWGRDTDAPFRTVGGTRLLRTGDLGVWTDGGLAIVGRVKDVIVVQWRNMHPADLEALAEAACGPLGVTRALVAGVSSGGAESALVFAELSRPSLRALDPEPIAAAARRAIGAEAPFAGVCLLKPGALPLTSSGKVRRGGCRAAFLAGRLEGVAWCDAGAGLLIERAGAATGGAAEAI